MDHLGSSFSSHSFAHWVFFVFSLSCALIFIFFLCLDPCPCPNQSLDSESCLHSFSLESEAEEMFSFSRPFPCTLVAFSPSSQLLASVHGLTVTVRLVYSLEVMGVFECDDVVTSLLWSPDSAFLVVGVHHRDLVHMFSVKHLNWVGRIRDSKLGIRWNGVGSSTSGLFVLTMARDGSWLTVWGVKEQKVVAKIAHPKFGERACAFDDSGKFLAVGCFYDRDYVSIYDIESWKLVYSFAVDCVHMMDFCWSPDSRCLCILDEPATSSLWIYSLNGAKLACITGLEIGLKNVSWCPSGRFFAIQTKVGCKVINNMTWKSIAEFRHTPSAIAPTVAVYVEKYQGADQTIESHNFAQISKLRLQELQRNSLQTIYDSQVPPIEFPAKTFVQSCTFDLLEWSCDSTYLAAREKSTSQSIWIWDMTKFSLHSILLQVSVVKSIKWHPCMNKLFLCTGNNRLFMWSNKGCCVIDLPISFFSILSLRWNTAGSALMLLDEINSCVCYVDGIYQDENEGFASQSQNIENREPLSASKDEFDPSLIERTSLNMAEIDNSSSTANLKAMPPLLSSPFTYHSVLSDLSISEKPLLSERESKLSSVSRINSGGSIRSDLDQGSSRSLNNLSDLGGSKPSNSSSYRSRTDISVQSEDSVRSNISTLSLQSIASSSSLPSVTFASSKENKLDQSALTGRSKPAEAQGSGRVKIPSLNLRLRSLK